jgi:hypothetical protein
MMGGNRYEPPVEAYIAAGLICKGAADIHRPKVEFCGGFIVKSRTRFGSEWSFVRMLINLYA